MAPQADRLPTTLGLEYLAMTSDLDLYRSAKLLIDQHGQNATLEAAMRADKLLAAGDMDGKRAWLLNIAAIEELQRIEKKPGETAH